MKKILILNLLAAGFLAGSAPACEPPYSRAAIAQLGQAAGSDYGDCPQTGDEDVAILPPVVPAFPMPETPSQPQLQPEIMPEMMPCYWNLDGQCAPGLPFPSFPGEGGGYCDETVPPICLGDSGKFCFPPCVVAGPVYNGPIVYETYRAGGADEALRQAYLGQPAAKALVAKRLFGNNEGAKKAFESDKGIKVMADEKVVSIISKGRVVRIGDAKLAGRVQKLVAPSSVGHIQSGNKILFYFGAAAAIECMTDDACWGAVGDAVSAVSEWANS